MPHDLCIAKGVKKLPPAHAGVFEFGSGNLRVWRYWQLPPCRVLPGGDCEQLAAESWELLKDSVRLRLRSDVPVGVFLSGGVDSSLVVAAAASVSDRPINTFTIALPGSKLDEAAYARLIADHFGTKHHVLELSVPSLDVVDELGWLVDEPLADSSLLPTYLVSKLTAQHVKVALGGDGGDEMYGGYHHYQQALVDEARLRLLPAGFAAAVAGLAGNLPAGLWGRNRLFAFRGGIEQYGVWGTPYFDIVLRRRILAPDVLAELGDSVDQPERSLLSLREDGADVVERLTRSDFRCGLPDSILVKVDRASMANALEVRAPFLDYRLVEHAFARIPSSCKATRFGRRYIQNTMVKNHLPSGFTMHRKQGFSIPMDEWLRKDDIYARLGELPEFISRTELQKLIRGEKHGRANGARIYALIMLNRAVRNMRMRS